MGLLRIPMMSILVAALVGCGATTSTNLDRSEANARILGSIKDTAISNAIVAQHALFPYHFVPDASILNELGKRDLGVLAAHYKSHPGQLIVRQGDASTELYLARLDTVMEVLTEAGVAAKRISIADDLPGGNGMASEKVREIMASEDSATPPSRHSERADGAQSSTVSGATAD